MDKEEFTRLVLAMESTLFHVSFTLLHNEQDCADVVQEAVIKAYAARSKLREQGYFKTWIVRILINECYTFLRRQRRYMPLEEEAVGGYGIVTEVSSPIREEYLDLYRAMEELSEKDRLCIQLFYMEDYSVRQIAQILKIPEGTVKSRMRRARLQLKGLLGED